jgi:predicted transcriptional regulator
MTEKDKSVPEQPNTDGNEAQTAAEPENTDKNEHMIPKSRLDEEISKRKELEERLQALEKASKEAEEKRLEDEQKWKELAEKRQQELEALKPKASIAEEQEKSLQAYLQAQIEEIPEDMRSLIPEQLTTLQKLDWLSVNKAKLMKPMGPDIEAGRRGAGSGGNVTITPTIKNAGQLFGLTEEQIKRAAQRKAEK